MDHISKGPVSTMPGTTSSVDPLSSARIDGLRRLCGYVENSSDTEVTIFQDDATQWWTVKVKSSATRTHRFHGAGFLEALDAAIAGFQREGTPEGL